MMSKKTMVKTKLKSKKREAKKHEKEWSKEQYNKLHQLVPSCICNNSQLKIEKTIPPKSLSNFNKYKFQYCDDKSTLFPEKPWWYITKLDDGRNLIVISPGYTHDIPQQYQK